MKNINKYLVLILIQWLPLVIHAQDYEHDYLLAEQNRILQAQDVEKNIDTYITNNIASYSLSQSDIDEITNSLGQEYGGNQNIPAAELQDALTNAKREMLRKNYFEVNPSITTLFDALPYTGAYRQQYCINPGFENETDLTSSPPIGSYTFRTRNYSGLQSSLMNSCNTAPLANGFGVSPTTGMQSNGDIRIITANQAEPYLLSRLSTGSVVPNTVFNGNNSILLNRSTGNNDVSSMEKVFQISDPITPPTITFNFLLVMTQHINPPNFPNTVSQPFFKIEVFDNSNNVFDQVCFESDDLINLNQLTARGVQLNIASVTGPNETIIYTQAWQQMTMNLPLTGMGTNARIVFTVGDCGASRHFSMVYLDDLCVRESCPATLTITQTVLSTSNGEFEEASDWINATNDIEANTNNTIYHAANFVELNPGFEAMTGSRFAAYPLGCTNTFVYKSSDLESTDSQSEKSDLKHATPKIELHPNPVNDLLHIDAIGMNITQIQISSIEGKRIQTLNANSNQETIDVRNFSNGIYLISIQTDDGQTITKKFLKN